MPEPVSPAAHSADLAPAPQTSAVSADAAAALEDRYRAGRGRRFDRRLGWGAAAVLVLAGVGFLVLSDWQSANTVSYQTVDFDVQGDHRVQLKFEVSADADARVACAVEALSSSKATVGWNIIEIPQSGKRSHTVTTTLTTTTLSVAAEVRSCWTVEADA